MGSKVKHLFTPVRKWHGNNIQILAELEMILLYDTRKKVTPFVIYHFHHLKKKIIREVFLVGADGVPLKVLTVYHLDTSAWNHDESSIHVI